MNLFEYAIATTPEEALASLPGDAAKAAIKAGGIDLLDRMKLGIAAPGRLVTIGNIPSLRGIRLEENSLHLGATATLSEIANHAEVKARFSAIAQAAGSAANPQIRNLATVAGNLLQRPRCWYYRNPDFPCFKKGGVVCFAKNGENRHHAILGGGPSYIVHPSTMATALVAFGATLRVSRAGQKEREVPLDGFFTLPARDEERENSLEPDELITSIVVPPPEAGSRGVYLVAKERQVYDWPLAEVAAVIAMKGLNVQRARIVLGAAAPIPWRAVDAEKAIIGKRVSLEVARAAAALAVADAKPLAHNGYKVPLFTTLVERAILAAAESRP